MGMIFMKFLLTNDDGILSPGLEVLVEAMKNYGEVYVVCPHRDQSAVGHSISFRNPLFIRETSKFGEEIKAWTVNGTPADCVKIAMEVLLPDTIDMVVSGINMGSNIGRDCYYSGTIGAAREAVFYGVPAIAVSLDLMAKEIPNFHAVKPLFSNTFGMLLNGQSSMEGLLSINIPNVDVDECKGIKFAPLDFSIQRYCYTEEVNTKGETIYWLKESQLPAPLKMSNGDEQLLRDHYVTVTPLAIEMTNYKRIEEIENDFNTRMKI